MSIIDRLRARVPGPRPPADGFAFPADPDRDPDRLARILARPAPGTTYCIHFTPRSGSSWLTGLLSATPHLSRPGEYFNPNLMPGAVAAMAAGDLDAYVDALARRFNTHGVFGFEITQPQLERVFGSVAAFDRHFGAAARIWLIREDIVAQAVSLDRMVRTGLAHSVGPRGGPPPVRASDGDYAYDAAAIAAQIDHIRGIERATEAMLAAGGHPVLRLSYEAMMARRPLATVRSVQRWLAVRPREGWEDAAPHHEKVGTDRNAAFAARFRDAHPERIAALERERAAMIAAVVRVPRDVPRGGGVGGDRNREGRSGA